MTAAFDVDVVPDHVRASVAARHPDPDRQARILAGLAGFYGTGGWTPERRGRVAHLLRPADSPPRHSAA